MPGFRFAWRLNRGAPVKVAYPLAKSMNGTGTPPAASMQEGDLVAYTTASALTTSSAKVMRPLLAADKTAHYEDGSGVRCGVFGVADGYEATNSSGLSLAESSSGGVISPTPSMGSMNPLHLCGHSQKAFIAATADTVFEAQLGTAAASAAAYAALVGGYAGITLSTTSGVTTYTVNTSDSGEDLLLVIVDIDPNDLTFKRVYVRFLGTGLTPTGSYMQYDTGNSYSAQ